ncbi:MAG: NfeD family protein [Deltaproteobacteria bacterium]|nr:NfeD family protein [Deltaproteobacteria bacterium]
MDPVTITFLVVGVLLIASEALHPSLVQVFFGAAALLVAGLRALGVVDSVSTSLLLWGFTSLGLTLPLRPMLKRYFKTGEAKHDLSNEDKDAMGEIVEVLEAVDDTGPNGRIRFQGTTWSAQCTDGSIPKGGHARLVYKDKLVWIVEAVSALEAAPERVPAADQLSDKEKDKVKA